MIHIHHISNSSIYCLDRTPHVCIVYHKKMTQLSQKVDKKTRFCAGPFFYIYFYSSDSPSEYISSASTSTTRSHLNLFCSKTRSFLILRLICFVASTGSGSNL